MSTVDANVGQREKQQKDDYLCGLIFAAKLS